MSDKKYAINEIFYSLQGEGFRAGTPNIFLRFSGCNLKCDVEAGEHSPGGFDCDTEFVSHRSMTAKEILEEINEIRGGCYCIIFTGGEPGLQLDKALISVLRNGIPDCYLAIETNGTIDVSDLKLDWVTLSPKVAEHAIKQPYADELKYVRGFGQGIPKPFIPSKHYLISPAFVGNFIDARAMEWCIELVKNNPSWRLSMQQHKVWRVR